MLCKALKFGVLFGIYDIVPFEPDLGPKIRENRILVKNCLQFLKYG